ncbi:MAG: primosomal protein N' [Candidatus Caenarcaniphilales bacterium]|nr:primosomal protein N' [Candidatus Caenarcaniphilales bacterium]
MNNIIAQVLIDLPKKVKDNLFYYLVPSDLLEMIKVGTLVEIPFGKQKCRGFVIRLIPERDLESSGDFKLKEINGVLALSIFDPAYLILLEWVGKYYMSDLLTVLKGVLPVGILSRLEERISLLPNQESNLAKLSQIENQILGLLKASKSGSLSIAHLKKQKLKVKSLARLVQNLEIKSLIKREVIVKKSVLGRKSNSLIDSEISKTPQREIKLNQEQRAAFEILCDGLQAPSHVPFLLKGVTGSGKTEIYFKLIENVLAAGKQVIYLVPEIALTLPTINRIKAHFQAYRTVVWHSDLSESERLTAWEACLEPYPLIILGARSAIFAPTSRLGLIVIDEEHDSSYKSGTRPFYDARRVASQRAKLSGALVVRGSATPTISSYYQAKKYQTLLPVNERFHRPNLPEVEIVDLRDEIAAGNKTIFSRLLKLEIGLALERSEQVILLHNRRGHSPHIFCRACGYVAFCDECHVPMIYHITDRLMHCHHCDRRQPLPLECPDCHSPQIKQAGLGTQKLEEELHRLHPEIEIMRIDRDVSKRDLKNIWESLTNSDKPQILLGTQLIAKGIDLPRVSLVGVMQAEASLFFPDYLAGERTFQLLTQAAGRAGRHEISGKVIFQTFVPDHPTIKIAASQNYEAFYENEIKERKLFLYPPFCEIARLIISQEDPLLVEKEAQIIKDSLLIYKNLKTVFQILGPSPCPITKLAGLYRWHILIKCMSLNPLRLWQSEVLSRLKLKARLNLDLNPTNLM